MSPPFVLSSLAAFACNAQEFGDNTLAATTERNVASIDTDKEFTMRNVLAFSLVPCLTLLLAGSPSPAQPTTIKVRESKPVTVNDARFVTVAEGEWIAIDDQSGPRHVPIELQLRITNLKKTDMIFHALGNFKPTIKREGGKAIEPACAADHCTVTRPILIPAGAIYTVIRKATLTWDAKEKTSSFVYQDGSGEWATYGPLDNGKYRVSFWYSTTRYPTDSQKNPVDGVPSWQGNAQTPEVTIEVINPPGKK